MSSPWIVILAILAVAAVYVLIPRMAHVFGRHRAPRWLPCPETGRPAKVDIDASRAALTSAFGEPDVRAQDCTLWPERSGCAESCLRLPEPAMPERLEARSSR